MIEFLLIYSMFFEKFVFQRNILPDSVEIITVGPQDKPLPIIWVSSKDFSINPSHFEYLVKLSEDDFIKSINIIGGYRCVSKNDAKLHKKYGTMSIRSYKDNIRLRTCVMSIKHTCLMTRDLRFSLMNNYSSDMLRPISDLQRALKCPRETL